MALSLIEVSVCRIMSAVRAVNGQRCGNYMDHTSKSLNANSS
jgi:hypothetical protein